ncbi:hypothetical protein [Paraburkholderia sp.]|uniref:hypothetical protein n=1 Tax=Paraburkholderia sp. TaxID=1926495 RepID=UPI0039E2B7F0
MLSSRYDPGTRQTPSIAARAAMSGGSGGGLLDAAVAVVGALAGESTADAVSTEGSDLTDDGHTSTLLGDAQPFEYTPGGDLSDDTTKVAAPMSPINCR